MIVIVAVIDFMIVGISELKIVFLRGVNGFIKFVLILLIVFFEFILFFFFMVRLKLVIIVWKNGEVLKNWVWIFIIFFNLGVLFLYILCNWGKIM